MAKSKAPAVSVEDRVRQALRTLAESEGEMRLSGRGESPPLLDGTPTAIKTVVEKLKNASRPLVVIRAEGRTEYVRLTAEGFAEVFSALSPDQVVTVAKRVGGGLPIDKRVGFYDDVVRRVPEAAVGLLEEQRAAVEAEKADAETRLAAAAKRREVEEATRQALREWERLQDERRRVRVETLRRELEIEGEKVATTGPTVPPTAPTPTEARPPVSRLRAETKEDLTFRRQMARRLVSSWLEAWEMGKDEGRQFVETAIWNTAGFRIVGEVGDEVEFDSELHESPEGMSTGAAAKIVRPGWVMDEEDGGTYLVLPALVGR